MTFEEQFAALGRELDVIKSTQGLHGQAITQMGRDLTALEDHTHNAPPPPPALDRAEGFGGEVTAHLGPKSYPTTRDEVLDAILTGGTAVQIPVGFDGELGDVVIPRDTAIVGLGDSHFRRTMLRNWENENVAIRNMHLHSSIGVVNNSDLVRSNGASHIWLDHLTLYGTDDEQIDFYAWPDNAHDNTDFAVSYCHLTPAHFGLLVGETERGPEQPETTRASIYGNWFQAYNRTPSINGGWFDLWDNYHGPGGFGGPGGDNEGGWANWGTNIGYGAQVDIRGDIYLARNRQADAPLSKRIALADDGDLRNALRTDQVQFMDHPWGYKTRRGYERTEQDFGVIPDYPSGYVRNVHYDRTRIEMMQLAGAS